MSGGIRLVGIREKYEEDVQVVNFFGVFDESDPTSKRDYSETLTTYIDGKTNIYDLGYWDGRPCQRDQDDSDRSKDKIGDYPVYVPPVRV